jgi:hypothetical protein
MGTGLQPALAEQLRQAANARKKAEEDAAELRAQLELMRQEMDGLKSAHAEHAKTLQDVAESNAELVRLKARQDAVAAALQSEQDAARGAELCRMSELQNAKDAASTINAAEEAAAEAAESEKQQLVQKVVCYALWQLLMEVLPGRPLHAKSPADIFHAIGLFLCSFLDMPCSKADAVVWSYWQTSTMRGLLENYAALNLNGKRLADSIVALLRQRRQAGGEDHAMEVLLTEKQAEGEAQRVTNALFADCKCITADYGREPGDVQRPGAPTVLNCALEGDGSVVVTFVEVDEAGGDPQDVEYTAIASVEQHAGNVHHEGHTATSGARSPIVVSGLAHGESYTFAVAAKNSLGHGPLSTVSAAVQVGLSRAHLAEKEQQELVKTVAQHGLAQQLHLAMPGQPLCSQPPEDILAAIGAVMRAYLDAPCAKSDGIAFTYWQDPAVGGFADDYATLDLSGHKLVDALLALLRHRNVLDDGQLLLARQPDIHATGITVIYTNHPSSPQFVSRLSAVCAHDRTTSSPRPRTSTSPDVHTLLLTSRAAPMTCDDRACRAYRSASWCPTAR